MVSDHFSLQCILIHNKSISVWILIDISAISYTFINFSFIYKHWFLTKPIYTPLDLKAFNGQNAGHITYTVTLFMFIPKRLTQCILFLVTELLKQNIILDYP